MRVVHFRVGPVADNIDVNSIHVIVKNGEPSISSYLSAAPRTAIIGFFESRTQTTPRQKEEQLMASNETDRPMTQDQLTKIMSILICVIPELSFDEAQAAINSKGVLAMDVVAAFVRFRTRPNEPVEDSTFLITVPYRGATTIEGLLTAGNYDWENENISDRNFPQERTGGEQIRIELVHLDRDITNKNALAELDSRGLRPANAAELLAFGVTFPKVQRTFPVLALGQTWRDPDGSRCVVALNGHDSRRSADMSGAVSVWDRACRFAGIRK